MGKIEYNNLILATIIEPPLQIKPPELNSCVIHSVLVLVSYFYFDACKFECEFFKVSWGCIHIVVKSIELGSATF